MTSDPWPAFLSVMARFLALLASSRETLDGAFWGSFCLDSVRSTAGPWALVLNISSNSSTFRSWDTHRSSQILNRWKAFVSPEWCLLLWMLPAGWTRHQCHWRWFRLSDLASELPSSAPASWTWSGLASLSSPLCETCEQGDMWGEDETGLRLVLRVTKVQLCVQTDQSVCAKLLKVNRHHCTCCYCQVQVRQVSRSVWDRPTEVCFSNITNIGLQLNSWMSITLGLIRANLSLGLYFIYLYLFSSQVRVGMILQSEHTSEKWDQTYDSDWQLWQLINWETSHWLAAAGFQVMEEWKKMEGGEVRVFCEDVRESKRTEQFESTLCEQNRRKETTC